MTLRQMIEALRMSKRVEVRDPEGYELFTCMSDSAALTPYLDCEVTEWFPGAAPFAKCDFTVYINNE